MNASAQAFEAYLARLYTDADERARFLRDPRSAAGAAGLDPAACDALVAIDRDGLELAARSYARKSGLRMVARSAARTGWLRQLKRWCALVQLLPSRARREPWR